MIKVSSFDPSPQSFPMQQLNPKLKAVLSSLDVQLEEELTRYRRLRPRRSAASTRERSRPQTDKPLNLISVKATGGRTEQQAATMATSASLPSTPVVPTPETLPTGASNEQFEDISAVESSAVSSSNSPTVPLPEISVATGTAIQPQFDDDLDPLPSLEEREKEPTTTSASDILLTPVGVGSMLLLLLASATWGYVAINPSSVSHLKRFFGPKTGTIAHNAPKSNPTNKPAGGTEIPNSPNLAAKEFEDLNLRSLSTLTSKSNLTNQLPGSAKPQIPVPSTAPLPSPAAVPLDLPNALLPASPQSPVVPPPPQVKQTKPTNPSAATSNQSSKKTAANQQKLVVAGPSGAKAENKYLVVMVYRGDRTLTQARSITPNAFVLRLPQGSRIQLAAFSSETEAKTKVQELQKKGIQAQIYRR